MSLPLASASDPLAKPLKLSVEVSTSYARLDHFGRLIFDECPTDQEHLIHPSSTDGERSTCRYSFMDFIPAHMFQRKGKWTITVTLEED